MDLTDRNLWSAFLGESKANRLYTAYGMRALQEGHPEAAEIFFEISGSETVHAMEHLRALGAVSTTLENLRRVVLEERYEGQNMYPRFIERARLEGRAQAQRAFELAMRRENRHLEMFEQALQSLEKKLGVAPGPAAPQATPPAPDSSKDASSGASEISSERTRIVGLERIREVVFGMQDGIISTMTVAASVMAATGKTAPTLIAAGASALGGTLSMASGSFLGSKAEKDLHESELRKEAREIAEKPEEELAELIELYIREGFSREQAESMAGKVSQDSQLWLKTMSEKELGLSLEATQEESPLKDAGAMGISFLAGAFLSIIPYLLLSSSAAISASVAASLALLFLLGMAKGRITGTGIWRSGLEILLIGVVAALAGWLLGHLAGV
ncbi:MAG: hypothetical protein A3G41_08465 [Elusimicrobia bacterium RIFCSPLOWO2_12_FULL_59_9]|nr:MAG: hypothetical protein A3G41_08465 [Elusimicrobia bacterium RIFCSPLOWO2_12_FULL_59_9]